MVTLGDKSAPRSVSRRVSIEVEILVLLVWHLLYLYRRNRVAATLAALSPVKRINAPCAVKTFAIKRDLARSLERRRQSRDLAVRPVTGR